MNSIIHSDQNLNIDNYLYHSIGPFRIDTFISILGKGIHPYLQIETTHPNRKKPFTASLGGNYGLRYSH